MLVYLNGGITRNPYLVVYFDEVVDQCNMHQ